MARSVLSRGTHPSCWSPLFRVQQQGFTVAVLQNDSYFILSDFRFPTSVPPRIGPKQSNRNARPGDLEFWEDMQYSYSSGWGLGDNQRQARELISGPRLGAKARFLSFNRTHSRAVTGLLTVLNPLNAELNPNCYLLALLGAHNFLHVIRIRVKSLTLRQLMLYVYGAPILDVSRSHTTTHHSR